MKAFVSELWPFLTGRSANPIYKRDLARWSGLWAWRRLGLSLPVITFAGAAIIAGVPMAVMMPVYIFPLYEWSSVVIAGLVALLVGQEIVKQLTCLGAAALSGAAMAAEAGEVDLLRLSPLSYRQIVMAKLAAALRPLQSLVIVSISARLALILALRWSTTLFEMRAMLNMALMTIRASMPPVVADVIYGISVWGYRLWEMLARQVDAVQSTGLWPLWLAYYVLQPAMDLALFSAAGIFAVSRARTRTGGLQAALGLGAILWIAGYLAERMVSIAASGIWLLSTGARFYVTVIQWMPGIPAMDGSYIVIGGPFEGMLIGIVLVKLALLWLLGRLASRRLAARYGMLQESR